MPLDNPPAIICEYADLRGGYVVDTIKCGDTIGKILFNVYPGVCVLHWLNLHNGRTDSVMYRCDNDPRRLLRMTPKAFDER